MIKRLFNSIVDLADQLFALAFGFGKELTRSPLTNRDIFLSLVQ